MPRRDASRGKTPQRYAAAAIPAAPSAQDIAAARLLLEPWEFLTSPVFRGERNVPVRRPFLLVGNHTLMGVLDVPLLVLGLHQRRGVFVRSMADHLHYAVPVWRDLLGRFGAVEGTPENCRELMRAGEPVLVFPGGGREVFKHKGERYQLIWKNRYGFIRMALEFGYPIVPFASVGAEECYEILLDSDEMRRSPLGPVLERIAPRPDEIPPLVRGVGPLPRLQRFYFWFGRPIETEALQGRQADEATCLALRARVQTAITRGITRLLHDRASDPGRNLPARLLQRLRSGRVV